MGRVTAHDLYLWFTIKCGFYQVIKTSLLPYSGIPTNSVGNRYTKQENLVITPQKYCNQIVIIVSKITHLFSCYFCVKTMFSSRFCVNIACLEPFLRQILPLIFDDEIHSKNKKFCVTQSNRRVIFVRHFRFPLYIL